MSAVLESPAAAGATLRTREGYAPQPPLARLAGPLALAAATLIVVEQAIGLTIDRPARDELAASLTAPIVTVYAVLELAAFCLLLLALAGLFEWQWEAAGKLGLIGFLVAFLGTALAAGDWWFESFAAPYFADVAPNAFDEPASGQLLTGGAITFYTFSLGWILFGIATLRARVFPRLAAGLTIVGGAAGAVAGMPPFQVPLALGVGWLGWSLLRSRRGDLSGEASSGRRDGGGQSGSRRAAPSGSLGL